MTRRQQADKRRAIATAAASADSGAAEALHQRGEHPSQALHWHDGGATFARAVERFEADHGAARILPESYYSAVRLMAVRCQTCGHGVAYLCVSPATPWATNVDIAHYAFWMPFRSDSRECQHTGSLPDTASLARPIFEAQQTKTGRRIFAAGASEKDVHYAVNTYWMNVLPD